MLARFDAGYEPVLRHSEDVSEPPGKYVRKDET